MAEQEGANGADEQAAAGTDTLPQVGVIAQYVKDLSFENPNAPAVYQWQGQPQMDVQFNIGSQSVGTDVHRTRSTSPPRPMRASPSRWSCSTPGCSPCGTFPRSS